MQLDVVMSSDSDHVKFHNLIKPCYSLSTAHGQCN